MLLILTGPSGVGKSPLMRGLGRLYPESMKALEALVLINSRYPRPGERDGVDYHFRRRDDIEKLKESETHIVMNVRGDLQALEVGKLLGDLERTSLVYEGNPFIAKILQTDKRMEMVPRRSVFLSPLSRGEIAALQEAANKSDAVEVVADIMRRKLLRRLHKQKGVAGLPDLQEIESRALSAWPELSMASIFDKVVVNHDGEDSENWDAFPVLVGDARKALQDVHEFFFGSSTTG